MPDSLKTLPVPEPLPADPIDEVELVGAPAKGGEMHFKEESAVADSASAPAPQEAVPEPLVRQSTDTISILAFQPKLCREYEAPATAAELKAMTVGRVPYTMGMEPHTRNLLPGYDSGVLCLVLGVLLLLAFNLRHYSTFLKNFPHDLFSVRRSDNLFDVRTLSETGIQASIVLMACLSEGIIINALIDSRLPDVPVQAFMTIGVLTLIAAAYYLFQLCAYRTVGYVFIDKVSSRQWLKGFNASQALLGLLLMLPALVVLFNPHEIGWVVVIAATVYIICRLLFIIKGFRLFYENFGSLVYFILYLCALETVPLVIIYRGIRFLCNSFS